MPRRPPLGLVLAVTVTGITVNTLITASITEILDGLAAPASLSGLLIGAATLPGIVLAPVIGLLADRYGRREVLVPCLLLFGVAGGLAGLAPSIWWLAALRFLQGAGSAGLINLGVVIIGDHWDGNDRARIIGWNSAVLTTSLAFLPTIGGTLTDLGSWRAPFAVYPLGLVTAVYAMRRLPAGSRHPDTLMQQIRDAAPLLRHSPVIVTVLAAMGTFALIFGPLLTVLPQHLADAFSLGPAQRGYVLGIPAVANAAAAMSLGRIRRRVARRHLLVVAGALLGTGMTLLGTAGALWGVTAGLLVFGLGEGLMVPNLQDIATGAAPPSQRGTSVALFVSGARLGQTVGPLSAGAAFAAWGAPPAFFAGSVLAASMSAALAAFLHRQRTADA